MAALRVHFFHTANVASEAAAAALHQIERGNAFLRQQGADITFDRYPIDRVSEEIPWSRSVLSDPVDGHAERMVIRGQCHQVAPSNRQGWSSGSSCRSRWGRASSRHGPRTWC